MCNTGGVERPENMCVSISTEHDGPHQLTNDCLSSHRYSRAALNVWARWAQLHPTHALFSCLYNRVQLPEFPSWNSWQLIWPSSASNNMSSSPLKKRVLLENPVHSYAPVRALWQRQLEKAIMTSFGRQRGKPPNLHQQFTPFVAEYADHEVNVRKSKRVSVSTLW